MMWLSEVAGFGAGGVVFQCDNTNNTVHECALSQVGTHADMTLDIART